jgi:hypothetical protein
MLVIARYRTRSLDLFRLVMQYFSLTNISRDVSRQPAEQAREELLASIRESRWMVFYTRTLP